MKPSQTASYRVRLERSQAFTPEEKKLVGLFMAELSDIVEQVQEPHLRELMIAIPRRDQQVSSGGYGEYLGHSGTRR